MNTRCDSLGDAATQWMLHDGPPFMAENLLVSLAIPSQARHLSEGITPSGLAVSE